MCGKKVPVLVPNMSFWLTIMQAKMINYVGVSQNNTEYDTISKY